MYILKVLKEAEVNLKDINLILSKERGIKFRTCPVSGHNFHGSVERKIISVQECLDKMDIPNMRLHIRAERVGSNTCMRWRVVQCVQLMMTRRSQGWINSDWEVMLPTLLCSIDCGKHSCDDKFVHGGDNVRCGGCRDASKVIFKSVLPVCDL